MIRNLASGLVVTLFVVLMPASQGYAEGLGDIGSDSVAVVAERSDAPVGGGSAGGSGLTGCEVRALQNGRLGSVDVDEGFGPKRRVHASEVTETVENGEIEKEFTFVTDEDDISEDQVGQGPDYNEEIVDGFVELDSGPTRVYRVTNCDQYALGQEEIVVAPDQATSLIPGLRVAFEEQLPVPELLLQPFDEENEWTFVQVPVDIRVTTESLAPLMLTADTGGPDFARLVDEDGNLGEQIQVRRTMTATATPSKVVFRSGDESADISGIECSVEDAVAPYVPEVPGACSYRYVNGSSITDSDAFDAEVLVEWDVAFNRNDGPDGTMDVEPSFLNEEIFVAEVKAVNI